jgi:hypothetical protein
VIIGIFAENGGEYKKAIETAAESLIVPLA